MPLASTWCRYPPLEAAIGVTAADVETLFCSVFPLLPAQVRSGRVRQLSAEDKGPALRPALEFVNPWGGSESQFAEPQRHWPSHPSQRTLQERIASRWKSLS